MYTRHAASNRAACTIYKVLPLLIRLSSEIGIAGAEEGDIADDDVDNTGSANQAADLDPGEFQHAIVNEVHLHFLLCCPARES